MAARKRFAVKTEDEEPEIPEKQVALTNKHTKRVNEKSQRQFQAYLTEVGERKQILELEVHELDNYLAGFWAGLRKNQPTKANDEEDGAELSTHGNTVHYKASSLDSIRHGLVVYSIDLIPKDLGHFHM